MTAQPRYLKVRRARQRLGVSQTVLGQLVKLVGKHHRALCQEEISDIERGRRVPTDAELEALSHALHWSPPSVLLEVLPIDDPEPGEGE